MKHLKSFPVVLLVVFALGFCSCNPDNPNGGDDDPVEKYLGTWQVSDQPARLNYQVTIERNPANSAEILLKNFADLGGTAVGLVVGNNVIIDKQTITSGYQVEGSGSYMNSTELRFDYELDDGIDKEKRTAVFAK